MTIVGEVLVHVVEWDPVRGSYGVLLDVLSLRRRGKSYTDPLKKF